MMTVFDARGKKLRNRQQQLDDVRAGGRGDVVGYGKRCSFNETFIRSNSTGSFGQDRDCFTTLDLHTLDRSLFCSLQAKEFIFVQFVFVPSSSFSLVLPFFLKHKKGSKRQCDGTNPSPSVVFMPGSVSFTGNWLSLSLSLSPRFLSSSICLRRKIFFFPSPLHCQLLPARPTAVQTVVFLLCGGFRVQVHRDTQSNREKGRGAPLASSFSLSFTCPEKDLPFLFSTLLLLLLLLLLLSFGHHGHQHRHHQLAISMEESVNGYSKNCKI